MTTSIRKALAFAMVALTALQGPAEAATYYYFRGGAQAGVQAAPKPPSPAPDGTFAILVDGAAVAVRGSAYSATTYVYGNSGPVSFSLSDGALPAGLSIAAATGTISGVPTSSGSRSFTVRGADSATGKIATDTHVLDVVDPFFISGAPVTSVASGASYSAAFSLGGGTQPYSFAATGLPAGLAMVSGATSATISGTAQAAGSYAVRITATESHGLSVAYPFTLRVVGPLAVSGLPPAEGTVGTPYSGQISVSGGTAPYVFTLAAGQLPAGLSLGAATGVVSGTPAAAGLADGLSVTVSDSSGQSVSSGPFAIDIAPSGNQHLVLSGTPGTTATEGSPYRAQWTAGGGTAPYLYSLAPNSGALPAGLTVDAAAGSIGGTPAAGSAGAYPGIVVQAKDAAGAVAAAPPYTLTVAAVQPLAVSGTPTDGQVAIPYAYHFSASGGSGGGYAFALSAGTLPAGLTLQPDGLLSGAPSVAGTFAGIRIRVTDSASNLATSTALTITVSPTPALIISGTAPAAATVGQGYGASWTAFDGSGSGYSFSSVGAALPPGLVLTEAGGAQAVLSGSPTAAGNYTGLQIRVTDSLGQSATTEAFSIAVAEANPVSVYWNPATRWTVGSPFLVGARTSGGTAWSYSGTLPPGVTQDPATGALSGTPTTAGSFGPIALTVTDGTHSATTSPATFIVSQPLTISMSAPTGALNVGDWWDSGTAVGGGIPASYRFSYSGQLPPGFRIYDGSIRGTASGSGGTYGPIVINVTDGVQTASTDPFSLTVNPPGPLTASWSPQTNWTAGSNMSAMASASGGDSANCAWTASGMLPPGVELVPWGNTASLSGRPTTAGTYGPITLTCSDGVQTASTDPAIFTVTLSGAPVSVSWFPSKQWSVGDYLYAWANPSGGNPAAYTWSYSGTLPPGVTLQTAAGNGNATSLAAGLLGSLSAGGTYGPITLTVSDGVTSASTSPVTFNVLWPALAVTGNLVADAQEGTPYSGSFAASGGNGAYAWSVAQGSLPAGLSLDPSSGALAGTPAPGSTGTYAGIVVRAADTIGDTALSAPFTLTVAPAATALALAASAPATTVVGVPYGADFSVAGGTGPYGFAVSGVPSELAVQASATFATLSGTPTVAGSYPVTVTATDATGASVSQAYTLRVVPPVTVGGNPAQDGQVGTPYTAQFAASGGAGGPYTYFIDFAALASDPSFEGLPGAAVDPATGAFSFAPPDVHQFASYDVAINAMDSTGLVGTPFRFTVNVDFTPVPLAIAGNPEANATVGSPYSDPGFSASGGGGAPYSYYVDWNGAQLPAGLSLDPSTGAINGTPSMGDAPGAYGPIVVNAFDANYDRVQSAPFTLQLAPYVPSGPLAIAGSAADGALNFAYTAAFSATGGDGPAYAYSLAPGSGPLPPGLSLSDQPSTGGAVISGWPTVRGNYGGIVVQVTDRSGAHVAATAPFAIAIGDPPLLIDGYPQTSWQTSYGPYSASFSASGGSGGRYTFSAASPLPAGFSIDPDTGTLSCACSAPGVYANIAIQVSDGTSTAQFPAFSVTVTGACAVSAVMGPQQMRVGQRYSAAFAASNGAPVQTSFQIWGHVPPGLSFDAARGVLGGTLSQAGSYDFQVLATACDGFSPSYRLNVSGPITIAGAPDADVFAGVYYASTGPVVSGGAGGNIFLVASGALPPGLVLDSNGKVRGTPEPAGLGQTFAGIVIQVQDANGATARTAPFAITVHPRRNPGGPLQIEMLPELPLVVVVDEDMPQISALASGGSGNYSYEVVPAGAPKARAQTRFRALSVQDVDPLPPGASFYAGESSARIAGRPTTEGAYIFAIRAIDNVTGEEAETQPGILLVSNFGVDMANQTLETGKRADIPSATHGGRGPFTFKPGGGMLPPGLTLSQATGRLSGVPTAGGQFIFSIVATDSAGTSAESAPITFEVDTVSSAECPVLSGGYFGPSGVVRKSIRYRSFTASGSDVSIEATAGTVVLGTEFEHVPFDDFARWFLANATDPGTYSPIVVVAWNADCSAETVRLPFEMVTPLQIEVPVDAPPATGGQPYTGPQITASGGKPDSYRFSAIGLPAGLKINPSTGRITGRPDPAAGDVISGKEYTVYIQVMDGYGYHDTDVMTLTVF